MVNRYRGEVLLKINDESFYLRPTFATLSGIEGALGMTISQIVTRLNAGQIGINAFATIVWYGLRGYDSNMRLSISDIGEKILEEGLFTFLANNKKEDGDNVIADFLIAGLIGEKEMRKLEEETEEKKEPAEEQTKKKTKDSGPT